MSQRLQTTAFRIFMVLMGVVWAGCGTGDFVPPPPSPAARDTSGGGAKGSNAATPTAGNDTFVIGSAVRNIEMVPARTTDPEQAAADRSTARSQAGYEKARLHILPDDDAPSPDQSADRNRSQAELVRGAVKRKPQVLIVEPDDPASEELARAIGEVRAAKIPVVVLGGTVAEAAKAPGAAPLIVVRPESFKPSAQRLVDLAIRNARTAKLNPEGGAILLVTEPSDRFVPDRLANVREALKAAKISAVAELRIPNNMEEGAKILRKRLKDDSKAVLVFTMDQNASQVSNTLAGQIIEDHPFVQAGYTSDKSLPRMALAGEFAAIAEFLPNRLIQRAISDAVAVAQGRSVKEKDELPILVIESPSSAGVPHHQFRQNQMRQERSKEG